MKEQLVRRLDRPEQIQVAQLLIKDFKLNCDDFPEFKKLVTVESSNYFIKRAFEVPDHPEFVPPHKVEDLFDGNANMLIYFVKELLHQADLQRELGNDQASTKYLQKAAGVW